MKYLVSILALTMCVCSANADSGRSAKFVGAPMTAPRYTASVNQLSALSVGTNEKNAGAGTATISVPQTVTPEPEVDRREAERNACINNNIGIGNTFVWASRYSDTSNYANMVEDTVNPQNNVCFVRVELKSTDESRISVSDIPAKYFMWGESIECGSWANAKDMEKRILDARKGARIGGIVASTIGGAGLGVGAMELFGNKLIGGKVQGQKDMTDTALYRSQLLVLKEKQPAQYEKYVADLKTLKRECEIDSNKDCSEYKSLIDEFAK